MYLKYPKLNTSDFKDYDWLFLCLANSNVCTFELNNAKYVLLGPSSAVIGARASRLARSLVDKIGRVLWVRSTVLGTSEFRIPVGSVRHPVS